MMVEVPKIRPPILSRKSHRVLDELRGFRHVFRHAYGYALDPDKVIALKVLLEKHWSTILADLSHFKEFLKSIVDTEK